MIGNTLVGTFHPETPNHCPPKSAVPKEGYFYRAVCNTPPTEEDFIIWILEPKNVHKLDSKEKHQCREFAISFFTVDGIERIRAFFKNPMTSYTGIAKVKLDLSCGVMQRTGKDMQHYDLWPYTDVALESKIESIIKLK